MGASISRFPFNFHPPADRPPKKYTACYRLRSEDASQDLLDRITRQRAEGRLGRVVLDCRCTHFDEETLDALEHAAGANKLVLEC